LGPFGFTAFIPVINHRAFWGRGKFQNPKAKLPAHKGGASRKGNFIYIVPLDPASKAGLAGHLPVKCQKG